jgi:hypothetical protein
MLFGDSTAKDRQCTYNTTLRHVCETIVAVEKQLVLHIGLCVHAHIALLIQHAMHMRHIVMSFVAPQSPLYFLAVCHKRHNFRKKVIEHKMCVFIFSTIFI